MTSAPRDGGLFVAQRQYGIHADLQDELVSTDLVEFRNEETNIADGGAVGGAGALRDSRGDEIDVCFGCARELGKGGESAR